MNPASFAHPTAGPSIPDGQSEQPQQLMHHPQLAGLNSYSQIPNRQQNPLMQQQYQPVMQQAQNTISAPAFNQRTPIPSHPDFGHLQQQHNGYAAQYLNGVGPGGHQGQGMNGNGSNPANIIGNAPGSIPADWIPASLQGLSLQSH